MDPLALFFSTAGRLSPKAFWRCLLVVYLASFASLSLLTGAATARANVWAFAAAQLAVLWAWTVLHMKRLRDAGRPPAGAFGVALLYGLSLALALLLVLVMQSGAPTPGQEAPAHSGLALALLIGLLVFLFDPNVLAPYTYVLKALALIACLPFVLSATFSLYTGLRRTVP
jgi:uncharacterized membrane protein YhaH (DUF805 family)